MPGIYSDTTLFASTPVGTAMAAMLGSMTDPLDQVLFAASADCDAYTLHKLGAPRPTTGTATQGSSVVDVADVSGIYAGDLLFFLSTGEQIEVTGVDPDYTSSGGVYSGDVYLMGSLGNDYSAGGPVQAYRQSFYLVGGHSIDPQDTAPMTQAGQLAEMHRPPIAVGGSARRMFVPEQPLWQVQAMYQTLPWTGVETGPIDISGIYVSRHGAIQLPIGFYNPRGTKWRIVYRAGYDVVPEDVRDACHLYMADKVARMANPLGADTLRNQQTAVGYGTGATGGISRFEAEAQRKLCRYRKVGTA
jgi:hypothetical protein